MYFPFGGQFLSKKLSKSDPKNYSKFLMRCEKLQVKIVGFPK
jgi:hypothetical protein